MSENFKFFKIAQKNLLLIIIEREIFNYNRE